MNEFDKLGVLAFYRRRVSCGSHVWIPSVTQEAGQGSHTGRIPQLVGGRQAPPNANCAKFLLRPVAKLARAKLLYPPVPPSQTSRTPTTFYPHARSISWLISQVCWGARRGRSRKGQKPGGHPRLFEEATSALYPPKTDRPAGNRGWNSLKAGSQKGGWKRVWRFLAKWIDSRFLCPPAVCRASTGH